MKAFCILLFTVFSISIKSQITFQKTVRSVNGAGASDCKVTSDGGYIITGTHNNGYNIFIYKVDSLGTTLWYKSWETSSNITSNHIIVCNDKGFLITGHSWVNTGTDVFLLKTDSLGNLEWSKTYGGPADDHGKSIQQTSDGSYLVFGDTKSYGNGMADFYLLKIDGNGDTLWTKTYGGLNDEFGIHLEYTADNGYLLAGYTNSFGSGSNDICLTKINANGSFLWSKLYGGTNNEILKNITQVQDGGFIAIGGTDHLGFTHPFLLKTDSIGNTQWSKIYKYPINGYTGCNVLQLQNGNYIVNGYLQDIIVFETNTIGDTIWTRGYSNSIHVRLNSLLLTAKKGCFGVGSLSPGGPSPYFNVFLMKMDSLGRSGCNYYNKIPIINPVSWTGTTASLAVSSGANTSTLITQTGNIMVMQTICSSINIGLEEKKTETNTVQIFPNPAKNSITISQTEPSFNKYEIYSLNGKLVAENKINSILQKVDLTGYAEGMYIVKLIGAQKVEYKKIVVVE